MTATPVLATERLRLARLGDADGAFMLDLLNQPSFLRYIGDRGVRSVEDARRYIRERIVTSYDRHGFGLYRVALREDGTPIGICGILKRETLADPDLGFAFLPDYWSRGYALEAARAVLDYERGRLPLPRVVAITTQDNEDSMRLLRKLGFREEGLVPAGDGGQALRLFASQAAGVPA